MFEFIEREKAAFEVQAICRTLGVSASGYYAWKLRLPCRRRREDERLKRLIAEIHRFSRGTYGAPRVRAELGFAHAVRCSEKRVARLMRLLGVHGVHRRRGRRTTVRSPEAVAAPDLVQRNFQATGPGQLLVADITYVPTWAGFLFLAVVVDAFSRRSACDREPPVAPAYPDQLALQDWLEELINAASPASPRPR